MKDAEVVWLGGRLVAAGRARVPATSRAVLEGVGLFETLRVRRGEAPLLDLHLARLRTSGRALGIPVPRTDWAAVVAALARRNGIADGVVRITLAPDFALAQCRPLPRGLGRERREGVSLLTLPARLMAPGVKGISRLGHWLAERQSGGEALLVDARDRVLETTRSNFFVLTARGLETARPPDVLPGIARGLVAELARNLGVPVRPRAPRLAERDGWREAFVTNAVRGVRPVAGIDGVACPPPAPDALLRRLQKGLDERMGLA